MSSAKAIHRPGAVRIGLLLGLLCLSTHVRAEELFALAGSTQTASSNSYGWELAFDRQLSERLAASLAWINEGHFAEHARDGAAVQFWLRGYSWQRVGLDLGLGPYLYFDTQPSTTPRGFTDRHGLGAVVSASLTVPLWHSLDLNLRANEIATAVNIDTFSALLGLGYRFGGGAGAAASPEARAPNGSTLELLNGEIIFNSLPTRERRVMGADYRLTLARWAAWSATWFYDPGSAPGVRNRFATQFWLLDEPIGRALLFSVGVGPYVVMGPLPNTADAPARVSGLSALRMDWQWSSRLKLILSWYRTFTSDDGDRDLITAGVGWHFNVP